jgi:hypothetical protein
MDNYDIWDTRDESLNDSKFDEDKFTVVDISDETMSSFYGSIREEDKLERESSEEMAAINQARNESLSMELENLKEAIKNDLADGRLDMDRAQLEWVLDRLGDQAMMNHLNFYLKDIVDERGLEEEKDSTYSIESYIERTEEKLDNIEAYLKEAETKSLLSEECRIALLRCFDDERANSLLERDEERDVLSQSTSSYDSFISNITKRK